MRKRLRLILEGEESDEDKTDYISQIGTVHLYLDNSTVDSPEILLPFTLSLYIALLLGVD